MGGMTDPLYGDGLLEYLEWGIPTHLDLKAG